MMNNKIYFNSPVVFNYKKNINKIIQLKNYASNGYFSKKCVKWLIKNLKVKDALLVHSCTAALEMCALLLNIKKGDEIIMPSYTFVSTAGAFVLRGGKPVFVDIDSTTCNIDPAKIEQSISKKTKAIVVVHYAGISCDMDPILKIAKKYKLYVIEDAAHGIMSTYKGRPLGSIGDLATLSFHETKNVHCGEGGALLINNPKFIKRAKIIRDKGTNRDLFNQNIVKKYTWIDYGSSYGLSEINASFLYAQFQKAKKIITQRKSIFNLYHQQLKILEQKGFILRPTIPSYSSFNGHMYYIQVLKKKRLDLIKYLNKKSIMSVFHYIPLHDSFFGKKKGVAKFSMDNTNIISKNLLRLPIHYEFEKNKAQIVCKTIYNLFNCKP